MSSGLLICTITLGWLLALSVVVLLCAAARHAEAASRVRIAPGRFKRERFTSLV